MEWADIRDQLSGKNTDKTLAALGIEPSRPRCPSCWQVIQVQKDEDFGVSLRCVTSVCVLGRLGWSWPEHFAAELWETDTLEEARQRLLERVG